MLGFLIFVGWVVIFCAPLIYSWIQDRYGHTASAKRWWFNAIWASGGGILIILLMRVFHIWTDVLWFKELGYTGRYWTVFWAQWRYFLVGGITSFIFFWVNIRLTHKVFAKEELREKVPALYLIALGISIAWALIGGLAVSSSWDKLLLYQNQVPFGIADPIFDKDVGFYVFTLPVLKLLRTFSTWTMFVTILAVAIIYVIQRAFLKEYATEIRYRSITHISILGIILMLVFIFWTRIAIWNIMFSTRGVVLGAGWTDVHVLITAYWFFIGALIVSMILLVISAIAKSIKATERLAIAGFGICFLTWLIAVAIVPAIIQHFSVSPNELAKETEYIKHNIAFTKQAYGLTNVTKSDFPVNPRLSFDILQQDEATLKSIRLWDWRVLQSTNSQNQAFRLYYAFPDVDVVRYRINGRLVQLMYSSRELDQERLARQSKTWQNTRLVYTHGFGGCGNPVNIFTSEGLPDYWIKDIPPVSAFPELTIKQPRIYFGALTMTHVYTKTKQPEFDYPKGDQNVTFSYDGPGGIEVGSGWRKFAFALRFDGIRLLTSKEITPHSRIMFQRDIESRVHTLAPFLVFDADYYQVVALGGLWFIWDAYTVSDHYPYSEPHGGYNYIRNSVKITLNAYTGKVDFYVFDENDPIIKTYAKIFPGFFKPASAMPAELRQHIRYPEGLLKIQGEIYSVYHMENPVVFYNREDAWDISKESSHGVVQETTPYYVVMTIPGEKKEEFVLMLPFTPLTTDETNPRNNMVAWLAGRCDGERYGELILYQFQKEQLVYGPLQIGIRINQNDIISKDFTLWNQQGSQVIPGNLLVIPLSNYRLLYVQPIYLQAQVGKMPELKRVVVASGDQLAYGTSFEDALKKLITEERPASLTTDNSLKQVAEYLESYRRLTGQGRFAEAGKVLEQLSNLVTKLLKEETRGKK